MVRNQTEPAEKDNSALVSEHKTQQRRTLWQQLRKYYYLNTLDAPLLSHPTVEQLKMNSQFDLVIFDYLFNDYNVGIAAHFQCPSVLISSSAINMATRNLVGNPSAAAFTKSQHIESASLRMTFWQRVQNHLIIGVEQLFLSILDSFQTKSFYDQYFPARLGYPAYKEAKRNISLVFVRTHFLQNGPLLSFPSVREVNGLQIPRTVSALPLDLQEWFDASDTNVIYMSFGSLANCTKLSADKRDAFLAAFKQLSGERVLWKWEGDELPNQPSNVRISKWLPQSDVLAHPKVKLFISHCGLGGISEARYHGVPVLAIPLFGDQFDNSERIVAEGWAKEMRLLAVTQETFQRVLTEMLTNKTYEEKAKLASESYRDRPMHPADEALYWVGYVLRHSGVRHMQNQAVDLNWFQYHSLDVFGFLICVCLISCKVIRWTVKLCFTIRRKEKLN